MINLFYLFLFPSLMLYRSDYCSWRDAIDSHAGKVIIFSTENFEIPSFYEITFQEDLNKDGIDETITEKFPGSEYVSIIHVPIGEIKISGEMKTDFGTY